MTALQSAMAALIGVFHEHAGKGGDATSLSKAELKGLLEAEFGGMLGSCQDKNAVDEIFKGLDQDGSGCVNFTEFVTMVAALTCATNQMLCKQ